MATVPLTTRSTRIAALLGAACLLALGPTTPAAAATLTDIHLNTGQQGSKATNFENNCDQVPGGRQAGVDGWVFVLPGNKGTLVSLHLTFNDGNANVTVDIPGSSYPNGIVTNGADKAYVQLPAGWTIVDGTGKADSPQGDKFNVTHVCRARGGTPESSPAKSPSKSPTPSGSKSFGGGGGGANGTDAGAGGGSLPITGTAVGGLVALGLALVGAGVALVVLRRRRDAVEFQA
jgi:LPXTG-motif cell wall-anchored protein